MMADKPWKVFERKTAALFNTTRRLMKGTSEISDIGGDDPDFPLILDCKLRKRSAWQVITWFKKVEQAAISTDNGKPVMKKWPVLCLREPGTGTKPSFAVVRREPFMKFILDRANIPSEQYFVQDIPSSKITPILQNWGTVIKAAKEYKREAKIDHVIPMMSIYNTHYDIEITVLRPEDLALIFREGKLLKQEVKNDEEV